MLPSVGQHLRGLENSLGAQMTSNARGERYFQIPQLR